MLHARKQDMLSFNQTCRKKRTKIEGSNEAVSQETGENEVYMCVVHLHYVMYFYSKGFYVHYCGYMETVTQNSSHRTSSLQQIL